MVAIRFAVAIVFVVSLASDAAAGCRGVNLKTRKIQSVQELYSSRSHPGRYFAEATFRRGSGRPLIIYYRRFRSAPGFYRRFIRHHECCHHTLRLKGHPGGDEIGANCCALRRMRASKSLVRRIKSYMIRHDVNSDTVVDYAGQGVAFWRRTAARCPRAARVR